MVTTLLEMLFKCTAGDGGGLWQLGLWSKEMAALGGVSVFHVYGALSVLAVRHTSCSAPQSY